MGAIKIRRKRQRGSTMVESALVLIVALCLMIGIADIGQMLFARSSVMERVRSALRYGAVDYNETKIRNIVLYGTATPAADARPGFGLTASMVAIARLDTNTTADRLKITVSNYPISFYAPLIARTVTGPAIVAVQAIEKPPDP
jgi:Flp pilus assembly protein TadG